MNEVPKTGLELQIEQEAKELESVPKIPIQKFVGSHKRCHICGRVWDANDMQKFDTHVRGANREACPFCHPNRGA